MIQTRTKQQIAFDGVQTAWQSDAFTQILHKQVTTKFSMDGVVPSEETPVAQPVMKKQMRPKVSPMKELQKTQKKLGSLVGTMDGIRMPFGQAHA